MNIKNSLVIAAAVCGLFVTVRSGFAQGSLTPPGPPAPTMKSLDQIYAQIELPRTPISSVPFIITSPGSYYLTTNFTCVSGQNGIEIIANNVTLDLNGFALLSGGGDNAIGIYIPNTQNNITVRNGSISDWAGNGVESVSMSSYNMVFERLNVSAGGDYGIYIQGSSVVRDCNSQNNAFEGISSGGGVISGCMVNNNYYGMEAYLCTISGCTANSNADVGLSFSFSAVSDCIASYNGGGGFYGISSSVSGCTANSNPGYGFQGSTITTSGCIAINNATYGFQVYSGAVSSCYASGNNTYGIYVNPGTVSGCTANNNYLAGIYAAPGTVSGCSVQNNYYSGIYIGAPGSQVIGNTCSSNNTAGSAYQHNIHIAASNNRVEDNHVTTTTFPGIEVDSGYANNIIVKNSVIGNGAGNYSVPSGNDVGPIGTAATSTSPWANISH